MYKATALLLSLLVTLAATGCASQSTEPLVSMPVSSMQYATSEPESLQDVINLIYTELDVTGLEDATASDLTDFFYLDSDLVEDFSIRYSDGRYGICDVAIIRPVEGHADEVIDALESRRDDCIARSESYDVFDSLNIAKNADIFTRGDYVIMLMMDDTQTARNIINEQLPG